MKHSHALNQVPDSEGAEHNQRPYWKNLHRDWRVWVVVLVMLAAIMAYVLSGDEAWRPRGQVQPPPAGTGGK
jgi:hypothetical protein